VYICTFYITYIYIVLPALLKVLIVGNGKVGKTSMLIRFSTGKYTDEYKKTYPPPLYFLSSCFFLLSSYIFKSVLCEVLCMHTYLSFVHCKTLTPQIPIVSLTIKLFLLALRIPPLFVCFISFVASIYSCFADQHYWHRLYGERNVCE